MKRSELKEAIKSEIKSVLLEEEEKLQMTYKGDPAHIKVQGFGGNEEGAKDTVLFVNVGGIGKRESKASKNALEKRLGLLDKKVDKIMFTDKDNISKEIKDISKSDFKIKSVLSEEIQVGDIVTLGGDSDELEVIDSREMFGSDMIAYRVKFPNGDTAEYSSDQLRLAEIAFGAADTDKRTGQVAGEIIELIRSTGVDPSDMMEIIGEEFGISFEFERVSFADIREEYLKEESRFPTQADIDDIENSGNIDIAYDKAMKLLKSLMNKSVSFADIREGTWSSGTYNEIGRFIQDVKNLKDKYYDIVGNDDVFDGLDRAEESAREMMINAPENRSDIREEEDDDAKDKKAYKGAAKMGKKKSKRDKVIDAYNEIGGGKEVKEKAKKAKEGDKEALNWLKTNQPKIKAYNDLKK